MNEFIFYRALSQRLTLSLTLLLFEVIFARFLVQLFVVS